MSQPSAARLIQDEVLPRLDQLNTRLGRVESIVSESGLNGHTPQLKAFLDRQAQRDAVWSYIRKPAGVVAATVGFISTAGWAVMAVTNVLHLFH